MDELDDLFRQELSGHASEPAADLWARLQARSQAAADAPNAADPVDTRFRARLAEHATPPRRELWERLEDEHLRPRPRRRPVVAWGRLAVAASLLLLVLAGGTGLWQSYQGGRATAPVATSRLARRGAASRPAITSHQPVPAGPTVITSQAVTHPVTRSAVNSALPAKHLAIGTIALAASQAGETQKNRKTPVVQATELKSSPSSGPVARTAGRPAPARPAVPGLPKPTPLPDAAAGPTLASTAGQNTPATAPEVILVEVRRGPATTAAPPAVVATALPRPTERKRLRLNGLLRQAGHLVQGEPVDLADAGLPDSLTLRTRLGSRLVSRTVQF